MTRRGLLVLSAWCAVLAFGGVWIERHLALSADLRLFMPAPRSEEQRLLLENIGENPASRLLLLGIDGARPEELSSISKALAASLREQAVFGLIANGADAPLEIPDDLLPYRYLLTDAFDARPLDATRLTSELRARLADLDSGASVVLEDWLPRDPTLETLRLANRWQPGSAPRLIGGVWFSADGSRALLVAETHAAAFDPDGQRRALEVLCATFAKVRGASSARLDVSGAGFFSAVIRDRTQTEATWLGGAATVGLLALMWIAYRNAWFMLSGALPLASAGLAGIAAVSAIFGSVHGITLAFGFTLIGVAQDYPVHLFSHVHAGETPADTARHVWPPLATGVASTCIAYLAFLLSGVTGLVQLAVLTVAGLLVAGLTTRFLLPHVVTARRDAAESRRLATLQARIDRAPRPLILLGLIPIAAAAAFTLHPDGFWQNDLSRLTPVPQELLRVDRELRREMGAPDVRYLLVASGNTEDAVLSALESIEPELARAVGSHGIGGFDDPALYLPSRALQARRRAALPAPAVLREILTHLPADLPFDAGAFEPFLADVGRARSLPPLTLASLRGTPLELRVGAGLLERHGRHYGLVTFYDVRDPAVLSNLARSHPGITFLDLKGASEELVAAQRGHILYCLGFSAGLLIVVIFIALRRGSRVLRVIAPMVLSTLVILAVLRAFDVSLSLFHLISLVLAAGLGLDYALFFEHAAPDPAEQRRTLHALLVCAISTLMVFALLMFSTVPVLAAMGVTVTIGVLSNFALALLISRQRVRA